MSSSIGQHLSCNGARRWHGTDACDKDKQGRCDVHLSNDWNANEEHNQTTEHGHVYVEKIDRLILMRNGFGYFNHARHAIHFNYCHEYICVCVCVATRVHRITHIRCDRLLNSTAYVYNICVTRVHRINVCCVSGRRVGGSTRNGNIRCSMFYCRKNEYFMYLIDAFGCRNNH